MKNTFSGEMLVVGWCIVCGFVSGVWYDFFKTLRKIGLDSYIVVAVQDIFFWIGETVIVYSAIFYANNGVLRWYEFFFVIFGFSLYRWLLSPFFICVWNRIFSLFKFVYTKLGIIAERIIKKQR